MLTDMLKSYPTFQSFSITQQEVYARLASAFEEDQTFLYQGPEELVESTQVGNRDQWETFLRFEPTVNYIKARMTQITQVAQRRAFLSLQQQAAAGNVQAVKEINELSGIMSKQDDNRIIVLHQIARPQNKEV